MVRAKYEAMISKLESLLEKHELVYYWHTDINNVTLTVKPTAVDGEQTSFIEDIEDEKSSGDASVSFVFKDGEVIINTVGKLFISESLMIKLKNIAKKLHYLYLQTFREEINKGSCDTPCLADENFDEDFDEEDFDEEESDEE